MDLPTAGHEDLLRAFAEPPARRHTNRVDEIRAGLPDEVRDRLDAVLADPRWSPGQIRQRLRAAGHEVAESTLRIYIRERGLR